MKISKETCKESNPKARYSEGFKRTVVADYETGQYSKIQIRLKYGLGGHSRLLEWCRKYGKLHYPKRDIKGRPLKDPQKQKIKELESPLAEARLHLMAYERLIAITEREEGIVILKKDVAKQLTSLAGPTPER